MCQCELTGLDTFTATEERQAFKMFAIVALICFVLALFHVQLGSIDLVVLGFVFIALHLIWAVNIPWGRVRGNP